MDANIAERWNILAREYQLSALDVKDGQVRRLVTNAAKGKAALVVKAAEILRKRLTTV